MKKDKKGIEISHCEISHWKVEGTDAFASIAPVWTDEELDIGPKNEDYYHTEPENIDAQTQELIKMTILKK